MKKFIFASDLHGDVQDVDTVNVLLEYTDIYSPDIRVFGGDLFDFRNIRKGAGPAEKQDSMAADVEAGLEFLSKFKPNILLLGNHDKRLWDTAEYHTHGIVQDAARQGVRDIMSRCRKLKCKVFPYDAAKGYYDLGYVRFVHGYHAGIYATKKHAEIFGRSGGIVLHGHTHAIQYHTIPKIGGSAGMGVGCLAQTDMSYNKHMTARTMHENGFAYGYIDGKDWEVFQAKKKGKKWRLVKEMISLG